MTGHRCLAALFLACVLCALSLSGCRERDYAPGNPTLQNNRYDNSMDPMSQTAPIFP